MRRNITSLLFGICIILAGLCYLGSAVFGWEFSLFFKGWWTLFLIIPAVAGLFSNGPKTSTILLLLLGILLLLNAQGVLSGQYLWAVMVAGGAVAIGGSMIRSYFCQSKVGHISAESRFPYDNGNPAGYTENAQADGGAANQPFTEGDIRDCPDYTAVFGEIDTRNLSRNLQGASVTSVFGGIALDLRGAEVHQDIVIEVTAVLGGVDIRAPQNVRIAVEKTPILGGVDFAAPSLPFDADAPLVTFVCTAVLGGVDIK